MNDDPDQLYRAAEDTIRRLSRAAEFRDGETSEHLTRVSLYCEAIGLALGLPFEQVRDIKIASLLHDVGKLGIPDSVWLKPGRFTDYERQMMQQHTEFGAGILSNSSNPVIELAASVALRHHEKWDGSGYPGGIKGHDIPLAARIVAVADVFDAVSSARRYKESYTLADSFSLLEKEAGSHFDPYLIEIFLQIRHKIEEIWLGNQDKIETDAEAHPFQAPTKSFQESISLSATSSERSRNIGPTVLILDSDPYQREVVSTEATRRGLKVYECSEQKEAKALFEADEIDLMIVELADPGFEQFVKQVKSKRPELPLLILTRDGDLTRRLSVAHLEHFSYLHKPLPPAAILDEVEERLPSQDEDPSLTVLAFDDDKVVLTVISRVLERNGYRVFTASDPSRFWHCLNENTPDLLLLDLEMPTLSGFEICRVLRSDVEFRHLPIVVLTAHQEILEYQKAFEAGADDVLSKPLQARRLLTRIESRLARNRAQQNSAGRDPLTGFVQKRLALRMAEQLFASALHHNLPFSVCALEIEDFPRMVAREGWQQSANYLRQVAEILHRGCRTEDILTRYKDSTLLVLLPGIDREVTEQRISSLNTKLSQHKGPLSALRCQARVAVSPTDGTELKSLLESIGIL